MNDRGSSASSTAKRARVRGTPKGRRADPKAREEVRALLKDAPLRFNGLYGAARAAELSGDKVKAKQLYGKLAATCGPTSTRKEVREAREKS